MSRRASARLELTWPNKDRRLLSHGSDTYEWVDPSDWRVSEIRLLHETAKHGTDADQNLLIQGDALHALNSLVRLPEYAEQYVGQVKLVYIDPPFNTGQAFAHYDDGVEHSVWLTMLRDRLVQIKKLLRPDGSVWVHLDDVESHRARVVLDEVFGADNFVGCVTWERTDLPQMQAEYFSVKHDSILVYRKSSTFRIGRFASDDVPTHYDKWDEEEERPYFTRTLRQTGPGSAREDRPTMWFPLIAPDGSEVWPIRDDGSEGRWRWGRDRYERDKWLIDWQRPRGGRWDPHTRTYWAGATERPADTIWTYTEVGSNRTAKLELRQLFPGARQFDTPKPEKLLERVLHLASNPGDIVLDCFAGSGTTAAVAQKMERRWVAVELSESNVDAFVRPRLLKVIHGEDPGGITSKKHTEFIGDLPEGIDFQQVKQAAELLAPLFEYGTFDELPKAPKTDAAGPLGQLVTFLRDHPETYEALVTNMAKQMRAAAKIKNVTTKTWNGGGGFTELTVGPAMFEDVDGVVVLSDWAVGGELAEAVAAQVGFEYAPDGPFAGRKGKTRLAVIDGMLTTSVVDYLLGHLDDGERLLVVAQALDPDADAYLKAKRSGSRAQKVPRDLARQGRRPSRLVRLDADGTTGDGEKA